MARPDEKNGKTLARPPKTSSAYWKSKVYLPTSGKGITGTAYVVRISHQGQRTTFPLHTANKTDAADKAAKIYRQITTAGWGAALHDLKPKPEKPSKVATVGDVIREFEAVFTGRARTLRTYAQAIRLIAGEIAGLKGDKSRFDYKGGHAAAFRARQDAVSLGKITKEAVDAWRTRRIREAGDNPETKRAATASADAYLRAAKSIFGKDTIDTLQKKLTLPDPLPFSAAKWKIHTRPYRQTLPPAEMILRARNRFRENEPQVWLAFSICLYGGMRRAEADNLTWEQIRFETGEVEIKTTPYFEPKHGHERTINLPPAVVAELSAMRASADPVFVLKGGKARPNSPVLYYRAKPTWSRLLAFLRECGIRSSKPIHELRKAGGSAVAVAFGHHAAQAFLGHADISTTLNSYAEPKSAVVSFGEEVAR